jgi:hypothetical protein
MAFGPYDLGSIALTGEPRRIADGIQGYADVVDQVAIYSFPLDARALERLGAVLAEIRAE